MEEVEQRMEQLPRDLMSMNASAISKLQDSSTSVGMTNSISQRFAIVSSTAGTGAFYIAN